MGSGVGEEVDGVLAAEVEVALRLGLEHFGQSDRLLVEVEV